MKPDRMRRGGWINERWRHLAAQRTRAQAERAAIDDSLRYPSGYSPVTLISTRPDPPDPTGALIDREIVTGECRHFCSGVEVIHGHESDVCDWQCHPHLRLDPERAARFDAKLAELEGRE